MNTRETEQQPNPPRFIESAKPRTKVVQLEWPIEHDGKLVDSVTVRRMTAAEVSAFIEDARELGEKAVLPMFDVDPAVIEALDADDAQAVNEVVADFLPRALRPA